MPRGHGAVQAGCRLKEALGEAFWPVPTVGGRALRQEVSKRRPMTYESPLLPRKPPSHSIAAKCSDVPLGDICSAAKMALGRWDDLFDHLVGAGE